MNAFSCFTFAVFQFCPCFTNLKIHSLELRFQSLAKYTPRDILTELCCKPRKAMTTHVCVSGLLQYLSLPTFYKACCKNEPVYLLSQI